MLNPLEKGPRVSVVIPTYNGQPLLEKHLPAVIKSLRSHDEIVIVDDASSDSTISWLKKEYDLVKVTSDSTDFKLWGSDQTAPRKKVTFKIIANQSNVRFGAACNRGVALATHPLIFLLNNDVSPEPDVLTYLVPYFQNQAVFGVGCLEIEQALTASDSTSSMIENLVLGGKNKLWFERGLFQHSRADDYTTGRTAWVSGGSGLFDRAKWLELGGFDKAFYPAYWEDVDLSYRAHQRGWHVLFDEQAKVYHFHETTNQTTFGQEKIAAMSWHHAQTFTWKNGTWWQRLLYLAWKPYHSYQWQKAHPPTQS